MKLQFNLVFTVFCCFSFFGFSQEDIQSSVDTTSFESRCDCLKARHSLEKEVLTNFSFEDGRVVFDSTFTEENRITTFLELHSIKQRCDQLVDDRSIADPCPYEAKLELLDEEFELVMRVIEMQPSRGCDDITPKK